MLPSFGLIRSVAAKTYKMIQYHFWTRLYIQTPRRIKRHLHLKCFHIFSPLFGYVCYEYRKQTLLFLVVNHCREITKWSIKM